MVDGPGAFFPAICCMNFLRDDAMFYTFIVKRRQGFYNLPKSMRFVFVGNNRNLKEIHLVLSSIPTVALSGKLLSKYLAYSGLNSSNNDIEER